MGNRQAGLGSLKKREMERRLNERHKEIKIADRKPVLCSSALSETETLSFSPMVRRTLRPGGVKERGGGKAGADTAPSDALRGRPSWAARGLGWA